MFTTTRLTMLPATLLLVAGLRNGRHTSARQSQPVNGQPPSKVGCSQAAPSRSKTPMVEKHPSARDWWSKGVLGVLDDHVHGHLDHPS